MNTCPLCDSQMKANRSEFGKKTNIQCPECGEYETYDDAIGHITDPNFGQDRKKEFQDTIRRLNEIKEKAGIVVVDKNGDKNIVARKVAKH